MLSQPFVLTTDASKSCWGVVLSQGSGSNEFAVSFASGTWDKTQSNYTTTEQELLAGMKGMHKYRHFLLGKNFTWFTDHQALKWLKSIKDPVQGP